MISKKNISLKRLKLYLKIMSASILEKFELIKTDNNSFQRILFIFNQFNLKKLYVHKVSV